MFVSSSQVPSLLQDDCSLTQPTEPQVNKHDIIRELSLASRDLITVDQEVLKDARAALRAKNSRLIPSL